MNATHQRTGTTSLRGILRRALGPASVASVASTAALVLAARAEGKAALRPTNATSHWLHGDAAATVEGADLGHTAVGYSTHHAATLFWALIYEAWLARSPAAGPAALVGRALAVSALAAAVDYGATPRRFTPGWEFVLTKRSMGLAYAAMAFGLAAGAARRDGVRPPGPAPRPRPAGWRARRAAARASA